MDKEWEVASDTKKDNWMLGEKRIMWYPNSEYMFEYFCKWWSWAPAHPNTATTGILAYILAYLLLVASDGSSFEGSK